MIVTVEISHYPLRDDYEADILSLIEIFRSNNQAKVWTNSMSTYIKGEWKDVNKLLSRGLETVWSKGNTSSTVMKIIPRELPVEEGFLEI